MRLRNEAATKLGFADYHALQLHLSELSQPQVLKLFDELDALTREPFARAKAEFDQKLADRRPAFLEIVDNAVLRSFDIHLQDIDPIVPQVAPSQYWMSVPS